MITEKTEIYLRNGDIVCFFNSSVYKIYEEIQLALSKGYIEKIKTITWDKVKNMKYIQTTVFSEKETNTPLHTYIQCMN